MAGAATGLCFPLQEKKRLEKVVGVVKGKGKGTGENSLHFVGKEECAGDPFALSLGGKTGHLGGLSGSDTVSHGVSSPKGGNTVRRKWLAGENLTVNCRLRTVNL